MNDWRHIDTLRTSMHPDGRAWLQIQSLVGRLYDADPAMADGTRALIDEVRDLAHDAVVATSEPSTTRGFCGETDPAETARRHRAMQAEVAARHPGWSCSERTDLVIAFLRIEPWDGRPCMTATICRDDVSESGYVIPEIVVGSDGVYDAGPPHFDALSDAIRWARRRGFRVWMERDVTRDLPGRDVIPSPQPH